MPLGQKLMQTMNHIIQDLFNQTKATLPTESFEFFQRFFSSRKK